MSRGYRVIIAAAVGWLILSALPEQSSANDNQRTPDHASAQALREIAAAIQATNEREKPDAGCPAGQDNRQSDLCAQWKAADAAKDSADWTRRTFWLALVGTVIGFLTLLAAGFAAKFARDAAIHTETGAKEAQRAADEAEQSRKSFIEKERGHLKFLSIQGNRGPKGVTLELRFDNKGSAMSEIVGVSYSITDNGTWPNHFLETENVFQVKIPPDAEDEFTIRFPDPQTDRFGIAGFVRYRTVTLDDCRTHFFCKIYPTSPNVISAYGLSASNIETWIPHDT